MYHCDTCGTDVRGLNEARRHAKQGHKTQRDAFAAGELHSLTRAPRAPLTDGDRVKMMNGQRGTVFTPEAGGFVRVTLDGDVVDSLIECAKLRRIES